VFNQPGVANAIETQFVPVKLNADENSATATWYGITRVPTDVIVTPDGQMVAKLISPPTPAAYVAEVTGAAGKYSSKPGQAFAKATTTAPMPSGINSAYAGLQVSPNVPLAVSPQQQQAAVPGATAPASLAAMINQQKPLAAGQDRLAGAPPITPIGSQPAGPQAFANPAASVAAQPPITPVGAAPGEMSPFASASVSPAAPPTPVLPPAPPKQINNPYAGLTPSAQLPVSAMPQQALSPSSGSAPRMPMGYDHSPLQAAAVGAAVSPPNAQTATAAGVGPVANAVPDARQLPPGAPPLGFEGYCPVSMRNSWKWVAGDPRYGVVHRGHTYWFAGAAEQKQFWTDPDRYTPALSGMDPVLKIDHQQDVPGRREHSLDYDGMFYMFASEATLQQFTANPQRYSTSVRQAMGVPRGRLVR
jgi:YHS domain-containing protein